MQYASQNLIPVTLELGGKSPNIFFEDVADSRDSFYDKALEGFTMFALNQGEVCTCPSRALIQSSIYDQFLPDAIDRVSQIVQGNPLDTCLLYTSDAADERSSVDLGGRRILKKKNNATHKNPDDINANNTRICHKCAQLI